eukprot:1668392-Pyramimonas_sp.AAC.2
MREGRASAMKHRESSSRKNGHHAPSLEHKRESREHPSRVKSRSAKEDAESGSRVEDPTEAGARAVK